MHQQNFLIICNIHRIHGRGFVTEVCSFAAAFILNATTLIAFPIKWAKKVKVTKQEECHIVPEIQPNLNETVSPMKYFLW